MVYKMKNIIYFVDSLSVGSGVISYIINNCIEYSNKEIKYIFWVRKKKDFNYEDLLNDRLNNRCEIIYFQDYKNIKELFGYIGRMLKNDNIIIHSHTSTYSVPIFLLARYYNIKNIILHSHSTKLSNNKMKEIINKIVSKIAVVLATDYWACSKEAGVYLFGKSKKEKFIIMENGIDYEKYKFSLENRDEIRNKYSINDNDIVIGHIGRISKEKNHKFILEIFKKILEIDRNFKLIIVGDGPQRKKIENMAIRYKIKDNIIFTGFLKDVNKILSSFDIMVFPSIHEGYPISLIEAQINGVYCIVSENITKDIKISNNIEFLSIYKSSEEWVNKIISIGYKKNKRDILENIDNKLNNKVTKYKVILKYNEMFSKKEIKNEK